MLWNVLAYFYNDQRFSLDFYHLLYFLFAVTILLYIFVLLQYLRFMPNVSAKKSNSTPTSGRNRSSWECLLVSIILVKVVQHIIYSKWSLIRNSAYAVLNRPLLSIIGCVSCLEYDEHYILNFPNGYGR